MWKYRKRRIEEYVNSNTTDNAIDKERKEETDFAHNPIHQAESLKFDTRGFGFSEGGHKWNSEETKKRLGIFAGMVGLKG